MNPVTADVVASVKSWSRSPSAVFFTLAFPLILMTVFGFLFSPGDDQLTLVAQDNDASPQSGQLLEALNRTGVLRLRFLAAGEDAAAAARAGDHHTTLVVPSGYGRDLAAGRAATLQLLTDASRVEGQRAEGVVRAVVDAVNLRASGAPERVRVAEAPLALEGGGRFIDFFLPGVIGMTMMTTALIGGLEVSAKMKVRGILRKIATTPIRKWEWVLAKVVFQVLLGGLSAAVILAVGVLAFGVQVRLGWEVPLLVVLGGAAFAGLAMVLSRWVREEDQANAAGSAVSFPMMFLAGTFFPIEGMPGFLQGVAHALPLTYLNQGLRAAMITGNEAAAALNLGVVAALALAAVAAGSLLLDWKEV